MTQDPQKNEAPGRAVTSNALIAKAFDGFAPLAESLSGLDAQLEEFARSRDRAILSEARRQRRAIREFEPAVTMIGQVKAGKTTLINALVGWPDLLPADVNPWTSVVTSLHLVPQGGHGAGRASFQFFSEEGWNHLLNRGGRVGELASRAGADEEVEKVRRQMDEMRAKSRERLGRRFEMLLGQSHDYDSFDEKMIERYVCLGDDFWDDDDISRNQGRFADITKSADLWVSRPELPLGLCIRDTPGVNDTFMVREQITIKALRGSRVCVLVLSAHQALTSVDLALIRLISNVKSRDVIIFVNRIDELADPAREVPEIRRSIVDTLKRHDGPADAQILFGSGFWANHALTGEYESLGLESANSLLNWAEANLEDGTPRDSTEAMIWHLSGVPALGKAIAERVSADSGTVLETKLERGIGNLRQSRKLAQRAQLRSLPSGAAGAMRPEQTLSAFDKVSEEALHRLDARFQALQVSFQDRIETARHRFLKRATATLVKHLELYGDEEIWTYDPTGLRMLLRSGYGVFVQSANKIGEEALSAAAAEISALCRAGFGLDEDDFTVQPPPLPAAPPPVALGQTIALDLSGGWWTRFWRRRRGYQAFVDDFSRLIYEETQPIADALRKDCADAHQAEVRATLSGFLESQRSLIASMSPPPGRGNVTPGPGYKTVSRKPKTGPLGRTVTRRISMAGR
ncbi:MAG: dynamin family protein [Pseudooceanicola sp.]